MSEQLKISFNKLTGDYTIDHDGFRWVSDGRLPYVIIRKKIGKKYRATYRTLQSATKKTVKQDGKSVTCRYEKFVAFGKVLDFALVTNAHIEDGNSVVFSIKAENETGYDIRAVYFPAPFNSKKKGKVSCHVDAMRQGFMLPDGYKENFASTFAYTKYLRKINTGDCYMPVWGRVCDDRMFSAIVETPYDACIFSSFGHHGAFLSSVHWASSLGKLSYERRIRFVFHHGGDYNTVAKDYRKYLSDRGELKTLREKIDENKNIENLIGCPVLHHKIYSNIQPKSQFYDKDGQNSALYASFYKRAEQMRALKAAGLKKLYIHTDGWGEHGYDNDHPYILPPCPEAGGWDGMKELADTCRELGYIFALHDQYRDFYYSSKFFDMEKAVTDINGGHPYCSIWDGGEHSFLCASQAPDFVKKTYTELEEHGIDVQGAYLDVFSIMWGDECFHPHHKITREQSIKYRAECFDYLNKKGLIMSSEEPGAQLINSICLVHHGPHALRQQVNGQAVGIPIPLLSLVYHDCLVIPWDWWNNWGIPKGESGELYCAMHAGMPYIHCYGEKDFKVGNDARSADVDLIEDGALKKEIERVERLCALQTKLCDKEMVRHEFVDGSRVQRTYYSDGTAVTADFGANTWKEETNVK